MHYEVPEKMCHKEWRKLVKKKQRSKRRTESAIKREAEEKVLRQCPVYKARKRAEEKLDAQKLERTLLLQEQRKREFVARDLVTHSIFLHQKKWKEEQLQAKLKKDTLISTTDVNSKERKIANNSQIIETSAEQRTTNPEPPSPHTLLKSEELCPFYVKTGCCRFGVRCSRSHINPPLSCTVLIQSLYQPPGHLLDSALEFDEKDDAVHFREFFDDICTEANKLGGLQEVRVCKNSCQHLKGNVYLNYKCSADAVAALRSLHGRYYAGKVVSCAFVAVNNFKHALCAQSWSNTCPKGNNNCNFVHPYSNPDMKFTGKPFLHQNRSTDASSTSGESKGRNSGNSRSYISETYSSRSRRLSPTSSKSMKQSPSSSRSKRGSPSSSRSRRRSPSSSRSRRRSPSSSRSKRESPSSSRFRRESPSLSRSRRESPSSSRSRRESPTSSRSRSRRESPTSSRSRRESPTSSRSKNQSPSSSRSKRESPSSSRSKNQSPSSSRSKRESPSSSRFKKESPSSSRTNYHSPSSSGSKNQAPSSSRFKKRSPSSSRSKNKSSSSTRSKRTRKYSQSPKSKNSDRYSRSPYRNYSKSPSRNYSPSPVRKIRKSPSPVSYWNIV